VTLFEVIVLGLVSTVRPTSLAAVYALLSTESPRRLMIAYVVAGLVFTVAFGVLVIWVFNGINISSGTNRTRGIAEIAGGLLVLAFAFAVKDGRLGGSHPADAPKARGRFDGLLERRLTVRTAIVAGPMTHIPGLFYLVALNVIVASQPTVAGGLAEVLVYNAIWFAIPLGALVTCIVAPDAAREGVGAIQRWTKLHARMIIVVVSFALGAGLVIHGLLTL
jgi:Sap, sulfolipid-1-addressing protein